jgi:predicted Rossmann fold flavoprotein
MSDQTDIAIIGAGAAGLAAAIFSAQAGAAARRVVLLDGATRVGAKILVAGGGRCNVTHWQVTPEDFHGPRNVVRNVLRAFDVSRTIDWFESMGVRLKREETGKLFPVTDDAHTVLNALLQRCGQLGVELRPEHRVTAIDAPASLTQNARHGSPLSERLFGISHGRGQLLASTVILATGGRSLPKTGSDGTGWQIVQPLGHTVTSTYPALVPLVLADRFFHRSLSGVSHEAELSTFADGRLVDRRAGSLLWTHFGVSGPVVMDASRFWVMAHAEGRAPELRVSLLPGRAFEQVERWLIDSASAAPRRTVVTQLAEILPRRLAEVLCEHLRINSGLGQLPRQERRSLVHALTSMSLPVVSDRGWNYAEVTAGGVPLSEVNARTMESRVMPGLYLVGEMLDCDGRIGGFNFQWAWSTGYLAGTAAGTAA